jgi:hypothetical protein
MTTVGYGDSHIQTTRKLIKKTKKPIISDLVGKVVATSASITGIILLAFPVSLIVENFAQAQHHSLIETQIKQCKDLEVSIQNQYH